MNIKHYLLLVFVGLFASCDFLDVVPEKMGTIEYVFRERKDAIKFLATCYSYLPNDGSQSSSIGRTMGTEVTTYFRNREAGVKITLDGNSKTSPQLHIWENMYRAIRDCNDFLDNVHLVRDLDGYEREKWIAEVKFLKAYYHWLLIQNYGPIILMKKTVPIDASPEEVRAYRAPLDECINYVIELMGEAINAPVSETGETMEPPLPLVVDDEITEYGRITRPIAAAIRAKIMVHAASPFYNGNTMYENFKDNRGVQLWTGAYDAGKWTKAAEACREAIDICHEAGYHLYEYDPSLEYVVAPSEETRLIIQPSVMITTPLNKETIWEDTRNGTSDIEKYAMPALNSEFRRVSVRSQLTPTLATAENFYSSNGVPIEEDKEWEANGWYDNRYTTTVTDASTRLMIEPGFTVPYLNLHREPRFYGSMAFNGSKWFGAGYAVPEKENPEDYQYTVKSYAGDVTGNPAGRNGEQYYSCTGYFTRKLCSPKTYVITGGSFTAQRYLWPRIRLADLYLLYAEALNESQDTPTENIWKEWIDPIRKRAGLEGVAESWSKHSIYSEKYKTKDGLRNIIHQERVIELALEGHFYWDMRRWSGGSTTARYDIMTEMNKPIRGWNYDGTDALSYNQIRTVYSISYTMRDYLWPIKESDIDINPNLAQNPGW